MLAAWRGSTMAVTRAKYRPALYDDERNRARAAAPQTRPAVQPGSAPAIAVDTALDRRSRERMIARLQLRGSSPDPENAALPGPRSRRSRRRDRNGFPWPDVLPRICSGTGCGEAAQTAARSAGSRHRPSAAPAHTAWHCRRAVATLTNTAPASSAPRLRTAPKIPSVWQRRRYAATHMLDFNRMGPTIGQPPNGS